MKVLRDSVLALEGEHVSAQFLRLAARGFRCYFGQICTRLLCSPFGLILSRCCWGRCQLHQDIDAAGSNDVRRDMRIGGGLKGPVAHLSDELYASLIHEQPRWGRSCNRTRRLGDQPTQELLPE